jgi:hypothetical protein
MSVPSTSRDQRVCAGASQLTRGTLRVGRKVKKDVNMFDQPYRQHWSVAKGEGHQVIIRLLACPMHLMRLACDCSLREVLVRDWFVFASS